MQYLDFALVALEQFYTPGLQSRALERDGRQSNALRHSPEIRRIDRGLSPSLGSDSNFLGKSLSDGEEAAQRLNVQRRKPSRPRLVRRRVFIVELPGTEGEPQVSCWLELFPTLT